MQAWLPMKQLHSNNKQTDFSRKKPKFVKFVTIKDFHGLQIAMNLNQKINLGYLDHPLYRSTRKIGLKLFFFTVERILNIPEIKKHLKYRKILDPCGFNGNVIKHYQKLGHEVVQFDDNIW